MTTCVAVPVARGWTVADLFSTSAARGLELTVGCVNANGKGQTAPPSRWHWRLEDLILDVDPRSAIVSVHREIGPRYRSPPLVRVVTSRTPMTGRRSRVVAVGRACVRRAVAAWRAYGGSR